MSDFLIRTVVRILNAFWGPEPKLTPRNTGHRSNYVTRDEDYATRARLYYGDDQY